MNKKKSENYVNARLRHIMARPAPDYQPGRDPGVINMVLNGTKTKVILEPAKNITQWYATINGEKLPKPMGMNRVYKEIARRNPPARSFIS